MKDIDEGSSRKCGNDQRSTFWIPEGNGIEFGNDHQSAWALVAAATAFFGLAILERTTPVLRLDCELFYKATLDQQAVSDPRHLTCPGHASVDGFPFSYISLGYITPSSVVLLVPSRTPVH